MYNIMIAGAAGDGIETTAAMLEKILMRSGCFVFSCRDFMSRIRGGHNFALIRFGEKPVYAHRDMLDGLVVLNGESYHLHRNALKKKSFVIADLSLGIQGQNILDFDLQAIARESGNKKTIGSVSIGILLRMFSLSLEAAEDVFRESFVKEVLSANLAALRKGYDAGRETFSLAVKPHKKHIHINGNDAMALGALAGGIRFYSAYPMSPATGLLNFFSARAGDFRIVAEQAEDEIAAINMALGASYTGARSMAGTSGGGFSLMVEALGFAGIAEIPVVLADIQRPGPATGLPTRTEQSDLHFVISASQGEFPRMVIAVKDHADAFYQTARAFYLAEKYQIPVILLGDQYLADSSVTIPRFNFTAVMKYAGTIRDQEKEEDDEPYLRYRLTKSGVSPFRIPGRTNGLVRVDSDEHDESGVITESAEMRNAMQRKRMSKIHLLRKELVEPEFYGDENPGILIAAFGSTAAAVRESVDIWNETSGEKLGALLFSDVYPLPCKRLMHYAGKSKCIVNIEQNYTGQLAGLIRQEALISCDRSILKYDGRQLSVDDILDGLKKISGSKGKKS